MPKISQELVDEIRRGSDIVEIIKEYIPLTQKGKNYFGVCPFHQDHSPSMSVSKEKQMYKCFSCGAAGNVFKFVSEIESISYVEAIRKVGEKIGISITLTKEYKSQEKYSQEYEIMNLAMLYFENSLNTASGVTAKEYLKNRGLNEEMIETFNIGLSLSNNSMYEFLKKKKINENDLLNLGLINQNGLEYKDVFVSRIIFPIHNIEGKVVGFTGRVYEKNKTPKYLNSKETKIFRKGNILFNYHRAREFIRTEKKVILVEGNMDAIRMYASGFKNTIALMGTSLTKEQISLIQKLRSPVILMLDNDNAGALATMNNGELLENAGIEVEVVRLSGEKDPDEYIIAHGVEAMMDNIKHPISFLEFKLNYLKTNKNLEDTFDLATYVKNVLKTLEGKDAITIDITLNKLVEEYHLSYDVLANELKTKKQEEIKISEKEKTSKKETRYDISAKHILYYMMNDAKFIKMYQKQLGFFKEENYRGIASEIIYYYEKNKQIEFADFLSYIEISPLKNEMYDITRSIKEETLDETSMEDYMRVIKEVLWKEKVKELKQELKNTSDIHKKELLANDIVEITKKIQEIRKERSVKK